MTFGKYELYEAAFLEKRYNWLTLEIIRVFLLGFFGFIGYFFFFLIPKVLRDRFWRTTIF